MEQDEKFSSISFSASLDVLFPINPGIYKISNNEHTITLEALHKVEGRHAIGSLEAKGTVVTSPQPKNAGTTSGFSVLLITYNLNHPLTVNEFGDKIAESITWCHSPMGLNFLLSELNRIIELYRHKNHAIWWNSLGTWNFDELIIRGVIYGTDVEKHMAVSDNKCNW